jgi:uncharacterized damage-inducible protein DinB
MGDPVLPALLAWNRAEIARWHAWFAVHPAALEVSMGPGAGAGTASVRKAIHHTFAVDLRYGQRLTGLPVSAFETIEAGGLDALFALGERGQELLAGWLARATAADLEHVHTFMTLSAGERTASGRKILAHTCTHHVRHWAQIATMLRASGMKSDWPHDFLLSDALR